MTTTPIIYDFDAIRKPKPAAAIASLFREWISVGRDLMAETDEGAAESLGELFSDLEYEIVTAPARTAEDFAIKAFITWYQDSAGSVFDPEGKQVITLEILREDAIRILADVDPAYGNLAEVQP